MKLLLAEDEPAIARPLCRLLEAEGWRVLAAGTVAGALALIAREEFDAALINLGLPDGSGLAVSRALRQRGDAAILILTARTDEASVVQSLEDGADDYIEKPFRARELVSRVRAVHRRRRPAAIYRCGGLVVDACGLQSWRDGLPLALSAQEYRLLLLFLAHPGQVLERGQILQALWDQGGCFVNDNTLTVTVKRLREKIESESGPHILTVRGVGYRWEGEPDAQP